MRPDCDKLECALNIHGQLIDLRPLRKVANNLIVQRSNGVQHGFSLCGAAKSCKSPGVTACNITSSSIVSLAAKQSQHIIYDVVDKVISVRSKYKYGPIKSRKYAFVELFDYNNLLLLMLSPWLKMLTSFLNSAEFRQVDIIIKCNWNVNDISTPKYIVPKTQGDKYKFVVESIYGCVKLPMKCNVSNVLTFFFEI